MAISTNRKRIVELSAAQVKATHPHLFRRAITATIRNIPPETEVAIVAVSIPNGALTEQQQDQLETAIANIAGVGVVKYLMGGQAPAASEVPEGGSIEATVSGQFRTKSAPQE